MKLFNTIQNEAFPGEVFQLGLEALDEIGRTSSAIIRISDDDDDNVGILTQTLSEMLNPFLVYTYTGGLFV